MELLKKIFDKQILKSDLFVGCAKKNIRCENFGTIHEENIYEDIFGVFIEKNGEYIDIFTNEIYQPLFKEGSLNTQWSNYVVSISRLEGRKDEFITFSTIRTIIKEARLEFSKLQQEVNSDLLEVSSDSIMVPFEQNQFQKRLFGIRICYINPYHSDIDKNAAIIKNIEEILSMRVTKESGKQLEGVVYNNSYRNSPDSSYIIATYNVANPLEPIESIVHRKILTSGCEF